MELSTGRPDPRAHTARQLWHAAGGTRVHEVGSDAGGSVWDTVLTGTAQQALFMLCTERGVACGHGARGGQGGWDLTPEEKGHL